MTQNIQVTKWSGKDNYECPVCSFAYLDKEVVIKHMSSAHGINSVEEDRLEWVIKEIDELPPAEPVKKEEKKPRKKRAKEVDNG